MPINTTHKQTNKKTQKLMLTSHSLDTRLQYSNSKQNQIWIIIKAIRLAICASCI